MLDRVWEEGLIKMNIELLFSKRIKSKDESIRTKMLNIAKYQLL